MMELLRISKSVIPTAPIAVLMDDGDGDEAEVGTYIVFNQADCQIPRIVRAGLPGAGPNGRVVPSPVRRYSPAVMALTV